MKIKLNLLKSNEKLEFNEINIDIKIDFIKKIILIIFMFKLK